VVHIGGINLTGRTSNLFNEYRAFLPCEPPLFGRASIHLEQLPLDETMALQMLLERSCPRLFRGQEQPAD
jgi:hypothetical protein